MNKAIVLISAIFWLTGCKPGMGDMGTPSYSSGTFNSALLPRLQAQPETASLKGSQFLQVSANGGIDPYHYTIQSGAGQVGYTTGQFQSANVTGTVVILVSDSSGQSTTIDISITSTGSTSVATNVTSNCNGIGNYPSVALMDTSPTGLAYALGEAPEPNPSACAAWCGELDAGYCMYSPDGAAGSGATPVCVAWPPNASLTSYTSGWVTYAGACL